MKTILLIEDDTILRENTAELLSISGYEVVTASNGMKGMELAQADPPDLIICDIMMPEMDGYHVLKELSKSRDTNTIPFIFLSAKTEKKEIRMGMELGADDYITKPFEEEELINAIESRLAKAEILREREQLTHTSKETLFTINDLKQCFLDEGTYLNFGAGEHIYELGNHSNYMYLIKKGMVKVHKEESLGKELIMKIYKEDEFFGYSSILHNPVYNEFATALKETSVYALSKEYLRKILGENSHLTMEFIELFAMGLAEFKDQLLQMAYGTVRKKTAAAILEFVVKLRGNKREGIHIYRSDLASLAGIATESFIRTMTEFKKEGFISIEGRSIRVLDIESLTKLSQS